MGRKIVAILLSAAVFPGLGQLYKGDLRKGVFLILSASLLLVILVLSFLILYSFGYADLVAQAGSAEAVPPEQLAALLGQTLSRPLILFTFGLLMATWSYSLVDAGRSARRAQEG
jgi:TM2 domain-containing membrane protein YozV